MSATCSKVRCQQTVLSRAAREHRETAPWCSATFGLGFEFLGTLHNPHSVHKSSGRCCARSCGADLTIVHAQVHLEIHRQFFTMPSLICGTGKCTSGSSSCPHCPCNASSTARNDKAVFQATRLATQRAIPLNTNVERDTMSTQAKNLVHFLAHV